MSERTARRARRILHAMLRLYPPEFRDTVGDDLIETLLARRQERMSASGTVGESAFWLLDVVRFAVDGVLERLHGVATIGHDARHALRQAMRAPGFHVVAVATIALGIGATSAMFAVADAVVFRPLRYDGSDALYLIHSRFGDSEFSSNSVANLDDIRAAASSFDWIAGAQDFSPALAGRGDPVRANGLVLTEGWFEGFGARASAGRLFVASDFVANAERVAVLSQPASRLLFGEGDAIGSMVMVDGVPHAVVGVMDPSWRDPEAVESGPRVMLWVPVRALDPDFAERDRFLFRIIGRLSERVELSAAHAELTAIGARLTEAHPDANTLGNGAGLDFTLYALKERTVAGVRDRLLLLLGAATLLLLLACANVANLFLSRGTARVAELAVRSALGASRSRIVRQLFTESLTIAALGGLAGALLGVAGLRAFIALAPDAVPRLWEAGFDLRIIGFVVAATMFTGVGFGVLPALRSSRGLAVAIRDRRSSAARPVLRAQSALVAVEVALALALVAGSALLLRSFARLIEVDPGFDPDGVVIVELRPDATLDAAGKRAFYDAILRQAGGIPSVRKAALSYSAPGGGGGAFVRVTPEAGLQPGLDRDFFRMNPVTPDYFPALGMNARRGRTFDTAGADDAALVVVINDAAAKRFFPATESPVGQRLKLGSAQSSAPIREIIGVVPDVVQNDPAGEPEPEVFVPWTQDALRRVTLTLKLQPGAPVPAEAIRGAVRAVASDLPIDGMTTMHERLEGTTADARFLALLVTSFAGLALLLAVIGTYATVSYVVSARMHEVGVRMALGARPGSVFRLIVLRSAGIATIGLFAGTALTLGLSRFIAAYVFGIGAQDPATIGTACAIIGGAAIIASVGPALRAASVSPDRVLRADS